MIFIWNRKSFPIKWYQHPQEIWGQMIDWKFFKNIFSTLWKSRKSANLIKFCQNFQFLTFVIFVAEISNKHFCKLDKILRNFPSWHFFVFVTVFKKFGFEICNLKHWSCDILERYCIGNKVLNMVSKWEFNITGDYHTHNFPSHLWLILVEPFLRKKYTNFFWKLWYTAYWRLENLLVFLKMCSYDDING